MFFPGSLPHKKLRLALLGVNNSNIKDMGNLVGNIYLKSKSFVERPFFLLILCYAILCYEHLKCCSGSGETSDVESLNSLVTKYANKKYSYK